MADIILVVVGLVIIVISFVISENDREEEKEIPVPVMTKELLEESIEDLNDVINKRFDRKFEERWEETIADADDQMGQISNEKIMAVHDFSGEVLEKINQNHEDVIFLYKMLNDKEEELKQMALEIDRSKNDWQSFYQRQKQDEYDRQESKRAPKEEGISSQRREKIKIMDSLEGLSRRERLKLLEAMDKGEIIADMEDLNPYEDVAGAKENEEERNLREYFREEEEDLGRDYADEAGRDLREEPRRDLGRDYIDEADGGEDFNEDLREEISEDVLDEEFLDDYISGAELISMQKEKKTAVQRDETEEGQIAGKTEGDRLSDGEDYGDAAGREYSLEGQNDEVEEHILKAAVRREEEVKQKEVKQEEVKQGTAKPFDNLAERQAQRLKQEREEKERSRRKKIGNMTAFTGSNWNQEVLRLHKEGKSVQDISKLLKKGQGEVKLVLDLFQKVEEND